MNLNYSLPVQAVRYQYMALSAHSDATYTKSGFKHRQLKETFVSVKVALHVRTC